MMKKVTFLLVAIVLVFALVLTAISCSGGGDTTPTQTEEPPAEATAIPHALEGFEDCAQCHNELSEAHADFTSEDCTTCHEPAA